MVKHSVCYSFVQRLCHWSNVSSQSSIAGAWMMVLQEATSIQDFNLIVDDGRKLGLVTNTAKCAVITDDENVLENFKHTGPDIKHTKISNAM
jgi:hypothetical protein